MKHTPPLSQLFLYSFLLFLLSGGIANAQQTNESSLSATINQQIADSKKNSADKLYLQLDRTNYASGDTLWFSAYLFDAAFLRRSTKSNVVYVELSDEQNVVQVRKLVLMSNGLGHGCIPLLKRDFPDGGYTLRAYTQWQRNFDESGIFKKQLYVGTPGADRWLVHLGTIVKDNTAQLHLQLLDKTKKPVAGQQVLLGVKQDEAILRRDKPQVTDANGYIDLAVRVRDSKSPVYATMHKGSYDDKHNVLYKFPITYNRPEKIDLQLMPEGGDLVNGISSVVGFKAIAEDGRGANVSGSVVDTAKNTVVANFTSLYKGMGSFSLTPKAGESYKAVIDLPDGTKKDYPLPSAKTSGTTLSVVNAIGTDSIAIRISASADQSGRYIVLGQSRGMICFAAKTTFGNGGKPVQTFKVAKSAFALGVAKFSLLDNHLKTLNERLTYNDNKDNLNITVTPHRSAYTPQDSVALTVEVKDKDGNPVRGAFSMSVVNSLAATTNADNPSLVSQVLLNADLKGYVETPDYYFTGNREKELDNLLLTQGWTSYPSQKESMQPFAPTFAAEPDITVSGKSTNALNKPITGNNLELISLNPFFSIDTLSNDKGEFTFKNLPPSDSLMYVRAKNKKGKITSTNIELNRRNWPTFAANRLQTPWYFNTDTIRLKLNETLLKNQEQQDKLAGIGKTLKEVEIVDKKIIPGSHNLNGPGEADQVIDEHDIAKEQPMTLLELLKKKVKGFRTTGIGLYTRYFIGAEEIYSEIPDGLGGFIIDGIAVRDIYKIPPPDKPGVTNTHQVDRGGYQGIRVFSGPKVSTSGSGAPPPNRSSIYQLLNSFSSDDIVGIEVMSMAFTSSYETNYLTPADKLEITFPVPFIEITTKSGRGPFFKKQPDYLLFKPIASVSQKDFYRPRYTVKNPAEAAFDNRVTIHWEPRFVTDKDGKAVVSFYAAGQPSAYTITTEGSDMNGSVGSKVQEIAIKPLSP